MPLHLPHLPKLIAKRRSSAIFGVAITAMLWAGVFLKFSQDERGDRKEAIHNIQSFAMVFEENVIRSIAELDNMLTYLRRSFETRNPSTGYNAVLHSIAFPPDIVVQAAIIDALGVLRASTAGPQPTPPLDLSYREHFQVQLHSKVDRLFISKPVVGRVSHRWSIQLTRRLLNPDGTFAGVVVASLDPQHFTKFYDKIDLASSASIALIGADGVVRSAGGQPSPLQMGKDIHGGELFARMQRGIGGGFEEQDAATGHLRLVTMRPVKGTPLWVAVSIDKSEALADAFADLRINCAVAAFITLVILAAMELIFHAEAREGNKATELELALQRMACLASEDSLTGLLNRRGLHSVLAGLRKQPVIGSHGENSVHYAILFIDLDRFKVINDTLGHRIGDLLLQETGGRLRNSIRSTDVLGRLGGDEFAVVARLNSGIQEPDALANKLLRVMREPFDLDGYSVRTTISIGIAVTPNDGDSGDKLLIAADLALYAAKEHNGDNYQFYRSQMSRELIVRRQIETDLRKAIEHSELRLHYQPIVNLNDNSVSGFEALARWNHHILGFVPPSDFIPVAEDTGMVTELGEWALCEACGKIAGLPGDFSLAVNLSPEQFSTSDVMSVVQRALRTSGLPANRLELEITERLLLDNNEHTLIVLRQLKQLGVCITLDDFGVGYSALGYLRKFPFDRIKIDRSFVTDLPTRNDQLAIIKAILSIARALEMSVTAEGVETTIQRDTLKTLGCDSAQGFLFSRPVPFEELAATVAGLTTSKAIAA